MHEDAHVVMEASAEERPLPPAGVSSNGDAAAADGADEGKGKRSTRRTMESMKRC